MCFECSIYAIYLSLQTCFLFVCLSSQLRYLEKIGLLSINIEISYVLICSAFCTDVRECQPNYYLPLPKLPPPHHIIPLYNELTCDQLIHFIIPNEYGFIEAPPKVQNLTHRCVPCILLSIINKSHSNSECSLIIHKIKLKALKKSLKSKCATITYKKKQFILREL